MFTTPQAFKKARRQHLKTTRNRDDTVDLDWTPFRAAEKRYKARFPPPDLSDVLDLLALVDAETVDGTGDGWLGRPYAVECKEISSKVYIVPSIPGTPWPCIRILMQDIHVAGLVLLPSFVSSEEQKELVRWSLRDQARHPNGTNLDAHYILPQDGLWNSYLDSRMDENQEIVIQPQSSSGQSPSTVPEELPGPRKLIDNTPAAVDNFALLSDSPKPLPSPSPTVRPAAPSVLLKKLRWANIGWHYHWGSKQYDFSRGTGTIQASVRDLCKRAVAMVSWEQVFEFGNDANWGEGGPDWKSWGETYGVPSLLHTIRNNHGLVL